MGAYQAENYIETEEHHYSAQEEISQFMNRFLGFVKRDNHRARTLSENLSSAGPLRVKDLKDAIDKLEMVYHCLDLERLKSVQLSIQVEAMNSVHRQKIGADNNSRSSADNLALRRRCNLLKNKIIRFTRTKGADRISYKKSNRMQSAYRVPKTLSDSITSAI